VPKKLQSRILKKIRYPYINMEVTIKNTLSAFQKASFKLKKTVEVYYLGMVKLLPIAPAYIFITEKGI